jgi:putative hemolysin
VSIDLKANQQKIRAVLNDTLYSVYPVVEGSLDEVAGVVYLKDMFRHLGEPNFQLKDYLQPASYISETTSAYMALSIFKKSGIHYSLVTDEYGTIMGLVTMNDILDALVGDGTEAGEEAWGIQEREDGSWLVDGDYPFHDFLHFFDLPSDIEPHTFDTLGGLILSKLGYIPKAGEKLVWTDLELEVVDMDRVKIDKVLVTRLEQSSS